MITFLLGCVGLYLLWVRLPKENDAAALLTETLPLVSVVIPARNEEQRLPVLLESLTSIQQLKLEIIVVDDQSEDETTAVAKSFGCQVVDAPERPKAWTGKSWACHYGSTFTNGELILFTDADTRFSESGLHRFISSHIEHDFDMSCPLIFHRSAQWWEYLVGVFHLLYLIGTNYGGRASQSRLYANGQCLLFRKDFYVQNSHFEIKEDLAEDMALAKRCLQSGGRYGVYASALVYDVQMFSSFHDFYHGWHRIFRLGLRHTSPQASLEITCVIIALLGCGKWVFGFPEIILALVSGIIVYLKQTQFGEFRWYGIFFIPVSILLFTWISIHALWSNLLQRTYHWRGRDYKNTNG